MIFVLLCLIGIYFYFGYLSLLDLNRKIRYKDKRNIFIWRTIVFLFWPIYKEIVREIN